jgi:predicted amidohydrolase YtcJ
VEDLDPLRGIAAGVTRTLDRRPSWGAAERVSALDALRATTEHPAWLAHAELERGRIRSGYLADLVVLDRDPVTADPRDLGEVQVVATMFDGRWVHNPPPW